MGGAATIGGIEMTTLATDLECLKVELRAYERFAHDLKITIDMFVETVSNKVIKVSLNSDVCNKFRGHLGRKYDAYRQLMSDISKIIDKLEKKQNEKEGSPDEEEEYTNDEMIRWVEAVERRYSPDEIKKRRNSVIEREERLQNLYRNCFMSDKAVEDGELQSTKSIRDQLESLNRKVELLKNLSFPYAYGWRELFEKVENNE